MTLGVTIPSIFTVIVINWMTWLRDEESILIEELWGRCGSLVSGSKNRRKIWSSNSVGGGHLIGTNDLLMRLYVQKQPFNSERVYSVVLHYSFPTQFLNPLISSYPINIVALCNALWAQFAKAPCSTGEEMTDEQIDRKDLAPCARTSQVMPLSQKEGNLWFFLSFNRD